MRAIKSNLPIDEAIYNEGFESGVRSAALTWEDIPKLIELTGKTFRTFSDAGKPDVPLQELYEEVLRRFNEQREKK